MTAATHRQLASFLWGICNLLRGPYKRNEYRSIEAYFKREVLPHVPDAWIDESKTNVGYEIPLNRHFYRYEPPRPLEAIEAAIKKLEDEILDLLKEVTA